MANVIQTFPKGSGGGGGHTILDSEGTAVAQESKLQFKGVSVTDNSTDGITEFEGEGLNADSIDDIADAAPVVPASKQYKTVSFDKLGVFTVSPTTYSVSGCHSVQSTKLLI